MSKSIRFWNRFAERYARRPIANPEAYQQKLALTREHLTADSEVLEYGCGTGSTALLHAEQVKHVVALDSSPKMIDIANRKAREGQVANVEFLTGTIFDLPHAPSSFDAVLALNVLHLIDDMAPTIVKSYELLRPGGVFVSSTECVGEKRGLLRAALPAMSWLGLAPAVNVVDIATLTERITAPGFEILTSVTPGGPTTVFIIAQKR